MKIAGNTTVYRTNELSSIIHRVYRALKKELTTQQLRRIEWERLHLTIRQRPRAGVPSINLTSINIPKRRLTEWAFAYIASALLCYRAGLSRDRIWHTSDYLNKFSSDIYVHKKDEAKPAKPKPVIDSPVAIQNLSRREFISRMRAKKNAAKKDDNSSNPR